MFRCQPSFTTKHFQSVYRCRCEVSPRVETKPTDQGCEHSGPVQLLSAYDSNFRAWNVHGFEASDFRTLGEGFWTPEEVVLDQAQTNLGDPLQTTLSFRVVMFMQLLEKLTGNSERLSDMAAGFAVYWKNTSRVSTKWPQWLGGMRDSCTCQECNDSVSWIYSISTCVW